MQFSVTALLLALSALSTASVITERQNGGRVVPTGACCVANTSLKQDACTTDAGAAGRCVPGGNPCGGSLSCVATANLECDAAVIERGKSLCRAKVAGGFIDGANVITSLSQAKVN
ncbi:hypothetical protein IFR04_016160 [Cadophora malorum]|uniref:Uncharacterized protein n=1 Tax=Cadophora malorum TaxID=108018 RepID=A0A8H7T1T4_9HELO|nr:hypothetical protein IFR04_016160 [Cadophora malorum]